MARLLLTAILLCVSIRVPGADDLKVSQLEQDVRDLQRQVQAQSRQLDELRLQLARPADRPKTATPAPSSTRAPAGSEVWLDASKWQQVQAGMTELEVVALLGPPTSMRLREADRVLLYALEIGSSGFLSGSVTLRGRVVAEVRKPELR